MTGPGCQSSSAAPKPRPPKIPLLDFGLTDEQRLLRDTVRDFARNEVAPVAEELDRTKSFPYELVAKMGELGLMG
ncbi:MAG: acyl-CoA dehydrogenase family protein, partial [Solirubrobacterales bacterium]